MAWEVAAVARPDRDRACAGRIIAAWPHPASRPFFSSDGDRAAWGRAELLRLTVALLGEGFSQAKRGTLDLRGLREDAFRKMPGSLCETELDGRLTERPDDPGMGRIEPLIVLAADREIELKVPATMALLEHGTQELVTEAELPQVRIGVIG